MIHLLTAEFHSPSEVVAYIWKILDVNLRLDSVDSEALLLGTGEIGLAVDLDTGGVSIGDYGAAARRLIGLWLQKRGAAQFDQVGAR